MSMKYKIVSAFRRELLVNIVNNALEDGWIVCGGPFVVPVVANTQFLQAMTRKDKEHGRVISTLPDLTSILTDPSYDTPLSSSINEEEE